MTVKIAREANEQQKKIVVLQESILDQQTKLSEQTGSLRTATWVLAVVTLLLFGSAVANAILMFQGNIGSNAQTAAISRLEKSIYGIQPVIGQLEKAIQRLPVTEAFLESSKEARQRIREQQTKERQKRLQGR